MTSDEFPKNENRAVPLNAGPTGGLNETVNSLEQARKCDGYAAILRGDYGGQVYLTCPVSRICCDDATLLRLLRDIDDLQWEDADGISVWFLYAPPGAPVVGGMQGGAVVEGLWIHSDLEDLGVSGAIENVINGKADRLIVPSEEALTEAAEAGDICAAFHLAERAELDFASTLRYYRQAAEGGMLSAQQKMYLHYGKEPEERIKWVKFVAERSAFDNRVHYAQFCLAEAYRLGEGVDKDCAAAAYWYERVADSGYSPAAGLELGRLYLHGDGIPTDQARAVMWLFLAKNGELGFWRSPLSPENQMKLEQLVSEVEESVPADVIHRAQEILLAKVKEGWR